MANLLTYTEQMDNSIWEKWDGLTVTADSQSPPTGGALLADTVADTSGVAPSEIRQSFTKTASDTSYYIFSLFIRKDTDQTRFPRFSHYYAGGAVGRSIRVNTQTGSIGADPGSPLPDDYGLVDYDANYWRVWMKQNDPTGVNSLCWFSVNPASSTTLTGSQDIAATGSIVMWGANITNNTALQEYEPHPFYNFSSDWTTIATLGSTANSYSDQTASGGVTYEYRVVATNAAGGSASNIVVATALSGDPFFPVSRRAMHHYRRDVYRSRVA
jgi:hypothetical protein